MAMKETVGSIRAYFILAGVLSLLVSAMPLIKSGVPLFTALGYVQAALALAFIIVGVQMQKLLEDSPGVVKAVVFANVLLVIGLYGLMTQFLTAEQMGAQLWRVVIGVAIGAYLLTNASRLSKELQEKKAAELVVENPPSTGV